MKILLAAFAVACALGIVPAIAQTPPSPAPAASASPAGSAAPAASPSPSSPPRPWQASGFAAASYNDSSLGPGTAGFSFANGAPSRVFDTISRAPMLNAINVQLQKSGALFGKIELTAGTNANVIASYPYANDPNALQSAFDVTQAYVGGSSGAFSLQAGKFETLAGAEVIEDPSDMNVSRSILFGYAVPFTHTGVRLTYTASPALSLIAGVNNGWDNLKGSGGGPTTEVGAAYTGSVLSVTAQGYAGNERYSNAMWSAAGDSPLGHRSLIDVVATYHAGSKLTLVGNYDDGRQTSVVLVDATGTALPGLGTASWSGFAGYAQYQFTPKLSAAVRSETFRDRGGYRTGDDQQWNETTLTLAYALSSPLTLRVEGRADGSNHPVWADAVGALHGAMQSLAAQVLVKF